MVIHPAVAIDHFKYSYDYLPSLNLAGLLKRAFKSSLLLLTKMLIYYGISVKCILTKFKLSTSFHFQDKCHSKVKIFLFSFISIVAENELLESWLTFIEKLQVLAILNVCFVLTTTLAAKHLLRIRNLLKFCFQLATLSKF